MTDKKERTKIVFSLDVGECKSVGFDLSKKNYSNQLREKLGIPLKTRDSIAQQMRELKKKYPNKAERMAMLKKILG